MNRLGWIGYLLQLLFFFLERATDGCPSGQHTLENWDTNRDNRYPPHWTAYWLSWNYSGQWEVMYSLLSATTWHRSQWEYRSGVGGWRRWWWDFLWGGLRGNIWIRGFWRMERVDFIEDIYINSKSSKSMHYYYSLRLHYLFILTTSVHLAFPWLMIIMWGIMKCRTFRLLCWW